MPVLTITKTYVNGVTLFSADLDNAFNSISTLLNTTGLDSSNIQIGGLLGTNLANATITNSQLASACVGTSQLASSAVTNAKMGSSAVAFQNIAPRAVQTTSISSSAITRALLPAVGPQVSSGVGDVFTTTSGSPVAITDLTVSITTSGRPVVIMMVPDGGTTPAAFTPTTGAQSLVIQLQRSDLGGIAYWKAGSAAALVNFAPSLSYLDTPAAGTYTYAFYIYASAAGNTVTISNCKIVAYEL